MLNREKLIEFKIATAAKEFNQTIWLIFLIYFIIYLIHYFVDFKMNLN